MARDDMLKRYLDAGMAFTQMTRTKAEAIVKDLVKAGEGGGGRRRPGVRPHRRARRPQQAEHRAAPRAGPPRGAGAARGGRHLRPVRAARRCRGGGRLDRCRRWLRGRRHEGPLRPGDAVASERHPVGRHAGEGHQGRRRDQGDRCLQGDRCVQGDEGDEGGRRGQGDEDRWRGEGDEGLRHQGDAVQGVGSARGQEGREGPCRQGDQGDQGQQGRQGLGRRSLGRLRHLSRRRLDAELVRRGLVSSREQAQEAIAAGRVLVAGVVADKPARQVSPSEAVALTGPAPRFVGRGGEKLDAALSRFAIDPSGRRCLDAGSSTGGFTDCLLQRGAREVVAVDVGYGQLHERLRRDPRVTSLERTNVRSLDVAAIGGEHPSLVVADLSFISLRTVAPALVALLAPGGDLVALVKPQFEAGRAEVSRGRGVVRGAEVWRRTLRDVVSGFAGVGAAMMGVMVSPLRGADGNVEFLAWFVVGSTPPAGAPNDLPPHVVESIDVAVAEAEGEAT